MGVRVGIAKSFVYQIYNTSENMKKDQNIFQKHERDRFGKFVGVAKWVNKLALLLCL